MDVLVVNGLNVIDERAVLERNQVLVCGDAFVRCDPLRLHRQFYFDAVAGLPLARDDGVALVDLGRVRFTVDREMLDSADRWRLLVELARGPIRNAQEQGECLWLFWIHGNR